MMPRDRADAILKCFESRTWCRWTTEGHVYELEPCGAAMILRCTSGEFMASWVVQNAYMGYHGELKILVENGYLALGFALEMKEEVLP